MNTLNYRQWCLALIAVFISTAYAGNINDTGVTTCSDDTHNGLPCPVENFPRQDAEYGSNSFDFKPLDAKGQATATTPACVYDQVTGLTWDVGATPDLTVAQAVDYATALNTSQWCSYRDWRLPTLLELQGIVKIGATSPVVDSNFFSNIMPRPVWSSTPDAENSQQQWIVDFDQGISSQHHTTDLAGVRLVRGDIVDQILVANANNTVTQPIANLMWAKCSEGRSGADCKTGTPLALNWSKALQAAKNSQLEGYNDWRLPNKKELESLLNYAQRSQARNTIQFPANATATYWSATPAQNETSKAWSIDLLKNYSQTAKMNSCLTLRLVRDLNAASPRAGEIPTKECVDGECLMWEDVCIGGWEDVCTSYTDVCNGYEDVCNGYEDVCNAYETICDEYAYVCIGYDDWGDCIYDYDYNQCISSHEECSSSSQECTGGWTPECTGGWTQECEFTESQCAGWEQQCTEYAQNCSYIVTPYAGTGGSISPDTAQTITSDDVASFTVTPDANYITDETVGGDCPAGAWDGEVWTTGTITADCTVEFTFTYVPVEYAVYSSVGTGGSVSPDTAQAIVEGNTASFTVTPDANYITDETVGGDCPAGAWDGEVWTTGTITADCTVEFTFTYVPVEYAVYSSVGTGGSVSPDTVQAIVEGNTASFTVTPDANYITDETVGGDCPAGAWDGEVWTTGTITADCTVEFTFTYVPVEYAVYSSVGTGGSVSPDTVQAIVEGNTASFTVTPDANYITDETVGGDCPAGSWDGEVWTTGTITADCTVEFTFTLNSYTVTASANPVAGGTISPNGNSTVTNGESINFTVSANTGYVKNTDVTGTCPPGNWNGNIWTTGNIYADCTVIFGFTKTYTVTPSVGTGGTINPNSVQTVTYGTTKAFVLTPNTGYQKNTTVTGTCPPGSWNGNIWTTGVITTNCSVGFSFSIINYTVTASAGTGGSVNPNGATLVDYGTRKVFTVTPNVGYTKNTTVAGTCPQGNWSGNSWTTATITANCTVSFSFSIIKYTVTASAGTGGSVNPTGATLVNHGDRKAFTVTALAGYQKNTAVTGTCPQGSWNGNTWTTGVITTNCSVGFSFTPIYINITPTVGNGGTISPSGVQTVAYGATKSFTVTPNAGYTRINTVTGTCPQGSWNGNIWTTGVLTSNCSIGFSFSIFSYTVTPSAGTGGTVTPNTVQTVPYGSTKSFTAAPNAGYTRINTVTGTCPQGSWNGNTWTTDPIVANCTVGFSFANPNTPPSAWMHPVNPIILVGKAFTLSIHAKTDGLKIGAFDFTMGYDNSRLVLDTSYQDSANACDSGICPGSGALSSTTINADVNNGSIRLAGFDPAGKGPSNDLQLVTVHFLAKQTLGSTPVDLTLNNLNTPQGDAMGTVAKGATVTLSPGNCGDADGNSLVNIVDALSVARYTVALPPPPTVNPTLADVDRNGRANIVDSMHIARYAVGLVVSPSVCGIGQPL